MSQDRPPRVRVTGSPRPGPSPHRPVDLGSESRLGEIYLGSLLAAQRRLAGRVLMLLLVLVGALPLVFFLVPSLVDVHLFGVPLPWVLLGGAVYPLLVALGWIFIRQAERNERNFVELTRESQR